MTKGTRLELPRSKGVTSAGFASKCGVHCWYMNQHGQGHSRSIVDQDVQAAHVLDGLLYSALDLVNLVQVGDHSIALRVAA